LGKDFRGYGLWELRSGLEGDEDEEGPIPEDVINTRVDVAAEWIIQAGRELLRSSLLNALPEKPRPNRVILGGPVLCFWVVEASVSSDVAFGSGVWGRCEVVELILRKGSTKR
jgi:hypothetical protein